MTGNGRVITDAFSIQKYGVALRRLVRNGSELLWTDGEVIVGNELYCIFHKRPPP